MSDEKEETVLAYLLVEFSKGCVTVSAALKDEDCEYVGNGSSVESARRDCFKRINESARRYRDFKDAITRHLDELK